MNCPVCNNEVSSQQPFCTHCGSPIAGVAPEFTPSPTPPPPPPETYSAPPVYVPPPPVYPAPPPAGSSGLSDNAAAAIAYVTIIPAIIFLIIEPYNKNPFVRFHSFQCLALAVVSLALHIVIFILASILHIIPFFGAILGALLHVGVTLVIFIAWLICIIKASQGQWYKLPFIGDFAQKQART